MDDATSSSKDDDLRSDDELEDAGMALFLHHRLANASSERLTTEEFLAGMGMEAHIERLPGA